MLCEQLDVDGSRLKIAGYAVVGCQSLTAFYENRNHLTNELRILTKFIEIRPNSDLALKITDHTNNQNGTTHPTFNLIRLSRHDFKRKCIKNIKKTVSTESNGVKIQHGRVIKSLRMN